MTERRPRSRGVCAILVSALAIGGGLTAAVRAQESPYAGMERRAVKALSDTDRAAYLRGDGMGLALAAELNGLPGPRHVLELADSLHLTAEQRARTSTLFDSMRDEAVRLGAAIVDAEERLDHRLRTRDIDTSSLAALTTEIGLLQGSLRFAHLSAHLTMSEILTPAQAARYQTLRGYAADDAGAHDHRHPPSEPDVP